ncbi:MAG: SDR family NAD(P)-dependent oxidoreductase [Gammaproteobacteria bacterium]|nr:SDR family NAD(P)-dependent oxidoreductase [Gammaproteobacteria bacterium]
MSLELFELTNRRALITGSTQGIGFTLAAGLAKAGAIPIINGRDKERVTQAADRLRKMGFACDEMAFDVTDRSGTAAAIDRIEVEIGPIDILVNNAGKQDRESLENFKDDNWDQLMDLNLNSVFVVSRSVARHMISRKRGKIINICSIQTALARPSIAPYTASKGAVANLTKGMCADWAKHNIQANGLAPGYFETELTKNLVEDETFNAWLCNRTPAGRWGQLDELTGAAVFLASDASSYVNGHILYIDGGMGACV